MARAIWKGAISFGLVNIPVELFPAEEHQEFKFTMLDKRDFSPVGYQRYSKRTKKTVDWENIVKGYEYEKDQYVVLTDEDFRRANVKASQTIDIQAFVPSSEIPIQYFETPYFLAPTERGKKVYALLRETLRSTGRVAVAQVVIRTTQHLAAVIPVGRALILNTMRYADQLHRTDESDLPDEGLKGMGITPKELDLAKRLISDMAEHWNPEAFKDTYHQDLLKRIHEKIRHGETKQITEPDEATAQPRSAQVIDLVALLQESLKSGARTADKARALRAVPTGKGVRAQAPAKAPSRSRTSASAVKRPAGRRKSA